MEQAGHGVFEFVDIFVFERLFGFVIELVFGLVVVFEFIFVVLFGFVFKRHNDTRADEKARRGFW